MPARPRKGAAPHFHRILRLSGLRRAAERAIDALDDVLDLLREPRLGLSRHLFTVAGELRVRSGPGSLAPRAAAARGLGPISSRMFCGREIARGRGQAHELPVAA